MMYEARVINLQHCSCTATETDIGCDPELLFGIGWSLVALAVDMCSSAPHRCLGILAQAEILHGCAGGEE